MDAVTERQSFVSRIVETDYRAGVDAYLCDARLQPLLGDAQIVLESLPEASVDMAMTSPPYWRKREYEDGGIGMEDDYHEYIRRLAQICSLIKRMLKPEGSFWLNLGDAYYAGGDEDQVWSRSLSPGDSPAIINGAIDVSELAERDAVRMTRSGTPYDPRFRVVVFDEMTRANEAALHAMLPLFDVRQRAPLPLKLQHRISRYSTTYAVSAPAQEPLTPSWIASPCKSGWARRQLWRCAMLRRSSTAQRRRKRRRHSPTCSGWHGLTQIRRCASRALLRLAHSSASFAAARCVRVALLRQSP